MQFKMLEIINLVKLRNRITYQSKAFNIALKSVRQAVSNIQRTIILDAKLKASGKIVF